MSEGLVMAVQHKAIKRLQAEVAAKEQDKLGLAELYHEACETGRELQKERDAALSERDELRRVVEEAPHASRCRVLIQDGAQDCNCWKAEVKK
jgi:hypothetical protein